MISVVIVDDHVVVRKGLRLLLEQQPDLTVVGESPTFCQNCTWQTAPRPPSTRYNNAWCRSRRHWKTSKESLPSRNQHGVHDGNITLERI
jgi:hypothetical protein